MIGNYAVEQSIHIGKKEVVFCVDKRAEHPYVVCYCDYNNPFSAPWPTEAVGTEDYLEAMQLFVTVCRHRSNRHELSWKNSSLTLPPLQSLTVSLT